LADAVRRLVDLTVATTAPPSDLDWAATELGRVADRLALHRPESPGSHSMAARGEDTFELTTMGERMPFDVVVGRYSPLALPVRITAEGRTAVGRGRFTLPYEGPPGCVHGAVLAATFDIVCTAANVLVGAAGPTVSLTLRYRRPTRLYEEAVFEAEVERTEGRRTHTSGRLVQGGDVTVEVEGVFAVLDRETTRTLGRRRPPGG
ncbi:MAG TPA: hotdog domain-containing protein, partial [Acidimicrobiales bacterium]